MSLTQEMKMDKTHFSVVSLSDEVVYRQSQTPQARLQALELIHQVMYG